MDRWVCARCGAFRSRVDLERSGGAETSATWICGSCGAAGSFVPESSPEGAKIVDHVSSETYHDRLEGAGYSLEWPSTPLGIGLSKGKETAGKGLKRLLKRVAGWFR